MTTTRRITRTIIMVLVVQSLIALSIPFVIDVNRWKPDPAALTLVLAGYFGSCIVGCLAALLAQRDLERIKIGRPTIH